ncbi:acetyl-CoA synthetase-like protein [Fomitiporia mediterranea MF3/22]|uniref:acetyl-CoA synthetase-like protein n=1 Tax=Fomitiporia mediterranea (strain MF3/22) TaxID=694068 RepID=UPI00044076D1|nr:acetyl-CoA synthetase-like protein [Fomitiporia mediterranea MF3/22]EJC99569.1 acetyl-CoA synthetase-like protein [Fomitiporia mediterranea MF3/22]
MSLSTSGFRTVQANESKTFSVPPLDGSFVLHQLYDYHGEHSKNHPLYIYEADAGKVRTISWSEAQRGIHRAQVYATEQLGDTITFQCFLLGLMRAGIQPFPISIRNSAIGVANMLQQTTACHIFVSADDAMQKVCRSALEEIGSGLSEYKLKSDGPTLLSTYSSLITALTFNLYIGSTAFPKLRHLTHRILLQMARSPWFGERDIHCETMAPATGMRLSVFRPTQPPIGLTPASQLASCIATGVTLLFGIPHFMEEWSSQPESVKILKKLNGIVFGGAPLSKAVGDVLESEGVPLWHIYGATEMGVVTRCMPKESQQFGWEYFFFSPHVEPVLVPQSEVTDSEEHVFELVTNPGPMGLCYIQTCISYSNTYTIKEHIITRSPLVVNALMFGRGRFQNGVILEPKMPFSVKGEDGGKLLEQFRNDIWPYVEKANAFAPTHSRIFKEVLNFLSNMTFLLKYSVQMIIVTDPSKPFEYTPKGNPRRHVSVTLYEKEINELYETVSAQGSSGPSPPVTWDEVSTMEYVRMLVGQTLRNAVRDDDNLFEFGCDRCVFIV